MTTGRINQVSATLRIRYKQQLLLVGAESKYARHEIMLPSTMFNTMQLLRMSEAYNITDTVATMQTMKMHPPHVLETCVAICTQWHAANAPTSSTSRY